MNQTQRCFKIIFILAGNEHTGLRNLDIASALSVSTSKSIRDLELLEREGIVERLAHNNTLWRITPRIGQVAKKIDEGYQRLSAQASDLYQRYQTKI